LPLADRLNVTHVLAEVDGDAHFPPIDPAAWRIVRSQDFPAGEKDSHATRYTVYERRRDDH
jgi:dihydrofolate reductase